MYRYYSIRNVIISIDIHTDLTNHLIEDAIYFANDFDVEKIYFCHVIDPSQYKEKKEIPSVETTKEQITSQIKKYISGGKYYEVLVLQGHRIKKTLSLICDLNIDLIFLGRQKIGLESGKFAKKIIRRALCSIFVLPQTKRRYEVHKLDRILLPIDFSEHSKLAIRKAVVVAKTNKSSLLCFNTYEIPAGQYKTGKSEEEIKEIMEANTQKKFKYLIEEFDITSELKVEFKCFLSPKRDIPKSIFDTAQYENIDMIIISSKGRSASATLLGSTTEKLVERNVSFPVLVFKSKIGNMTFFDYLKNL